MIDILNYTYAELAAFMRETLKEPAFRTDQVWHWLWNKRAQSFAAMTNVSKTTRALLEEHCRIHWPEIAEQQTSSDGTVKFLLRLADGALVETVLIPSESREGKGRMTQCLSCQVGCAMGCTFCATGGLGFTRNMTMGEILGQVLVAREYLKDDLPREAPKLRNLVFMGMGEPLHNLREVMRSLEMLNEPRGLSFSPRRITVSTCGMEKGLRELGDSGLAYLAVSLHAPDQELREELMPKAARWKLADLMATLESYPLKTRERMTFEYLLLGGVNDTPAHAKALVRLLSRVKGKLNIIIYNAVPGSAFQAPKPADVELFESILRAKHITVIVRKSKGQDIDAACGQLRASYGE